MTFRIAVAPMMDCTDRHDRYFLRLIAPSIHLYTEMITTAALLHGDKTHLLTFHPNEKYLALQIGGNTPSELAYCARLGEEAGYDEINLNVGCPSSRVRSGQFGACLMLNPSLVAECIAAMAAQVRIPVTVKCRIGVDEFDSSENLHHFLWLVSQAGCKTFIIHARKAWLSGLSPRENREIPPLQYDRVLEMKALFPHLNIIINGGFKTVADIKAITPYVDGVMIGRAAYANPYFLSEVERTFFANPALLTRHEVVEAYLPYVTVQLQNRVRLTSMTRHIIGLYHGERGAQSWRRYLSEESHREGADIQVIRQALALVTRAQGEWNV